MVNATKGLGHQTQLQPVVVHNRDTAVEYKTPEMRTTMVYDAIHMRNDSSEDFRLNQIANRQQRLEFELK
ncbi:hypothetical protein P8452_23576 [Trifolium repens]|nr:hypothetical protein P8452_23576 [Trifolium repens]